MQYSHEETKIVQIYKFKEKDKNMYEYHIKLLNYTYCTVTLLS